MRLGSVRLILIVFILLVALPGRLPAPLVFTPGEGWSYQTPGKDDGNWKKDRAKAQLSVAQKAFQDGNYGRAAKAARRVAKRWPLSDFTAEARYLLGRAHEKQGNDYRAFKDYQELLSKHPNFDNYSQVLKRQFEIANRYLQGKRFKLWGLMRLYQSMDKTVEMYEKIIKNGPYSEIAAKAQLKIGQAREEKGEWDKAVKAYERAADRYHDRGEIASDALFKAGLAYQKQAREAEYSQNLANKAIETFSDFVTLYPDDPRAPKAKKKITKLKTEQARGSFQVAQYYEGKEDWDGALIYYNEVLLKAPDSKYAEKARKRIEAIKDIRAKNKSTETG